MKSIISSIILMSVALQAHATYTWVGVTSEDFFNEANWVDSETSVAPVSGSIDPAINIDVELVVSGDVTITGGGGNLYLGTGSLSVTDAALSNFGNLRESTATGGAASTFNLAGSASLQGNGFAESARFNLSDAASLTVGSLFDNGPTYVNFTSNTITGSVQITSQSLAAVQTLADNDRFRIAGVIVGQSDLNIVAEAGDVFVTPIPEPSHLALSILAGGAGICFSRRRRNRRAMALD